MTGAVLDFYLKPILKLMEADDVTELVINRPCEVGIEDRNGWHWIEDDTFNTEWLSSVAKLAAANTGQDISDTQPIVSTTLPKGERCQIIIPPAVPKGTISITIRKPSKAELSLTDLDKYGLFNDIRDQSEANPTEQKLVGLYRAKQWREFLKLAVEAKLNIVISGATGSGKTTLAKALIQNIPLHERILTIEDARELILPHRNVVNMIYSKDNLGRAKMTAKDLLESALRMRPDRILLQELRDATAFFYIRNVNSGHPGSITTVHANSAETAFEQLMLLVKESEGGSQLSRTEILQLLRSLVDVVIQAKKVNGRFLISEVYYAPALKS